MYKNKLGMYNNQFNDHSYYVMAVYKTKFIKNDKFVVMYVYDK